jgi:hypothetical protein
MGGGIQKWRNEEHRGRPAASETVDNVDRNNAVSRSIAVATVDEIQHINCGFVYCMHDKLSYRKFCVRCIPQKLRHVKADMFSGSHAIFAEIS